MLALGAAAALLVAPAMGESVDWGQTYFDGGHTGSNGRETVLSAANVSGLQLGWSRSFAGEVRSFVVNDHYVIARVPSHDSNSMELWYLNYATGETVWHRDIGPDVSSADGTLATGDQRIFTACGLVDQVGYKYSGICAYRKGEGRKAWEFSNPCNCTPEANVVTPLVYARHVVLFGYFNGGSEGKEYVIAANSITGEILGTHQTGGIGSLGSASIAYGLSRIYFDCGGSACALRRRGGFAWKSDMGAPLGGLTADRKHHIFASLCNGPAGLVALDEAAGAQLWSYGASQCNRTPPAISGDRLYLTAADGNVHALDAGSGTEIWSGAAGSISAPSLANGVLYVAGGTGAPAASAYDAGTGALLWSTPPNASSYHPAPMVIDGTLYVANASCGGICAFNLPISAKRSAPPPGKGLTTR